MITGYAMAEPISIHAPLKGATIAYGHTRGRPGISIHAPLKGATCRQRYGRRCSGHFNLRSLEGSDERHEVQWTLSEKFQSTLP